jgi:hypothetical protein
MSDPIDQVWSRSIVKENIHMWEQLYTERLGGAVAGWLVDTRTESLAEPHLMPPPSPDSTHGRKALPCLSGGWPTRLNPNCSQIFRVPNLRGVGERVSAFEFVVCLVAITTNKKGGAEPQPRLSALQTLR